MHYKESHRMNELQQSMVSNLHSQLLHFLVWIERLTKLKPINEPMVNHVIYTCPKSGSWTNLYPNFLEHTVAIAQTNVFTDASPPAPGHVLCSVRKPSKCTVRPGECSLLLHLSYPLFPLQSQNLSFGYFYHLFNLNRTK